MDNPKYIVLRNIVGMVAALVCLHRGGVTPKGAVEQGVEFVEACEKKQLLTRSMMDA